MSNPSGWYLDTGLLTPRQVMTQEFDSEKQGYTLELDCGHSIWSGRNSRDDAFCGQCLQQLVQQIRELQEQQRIP